MTGFELVDLTVGNGTASELQGDTASYTATVTPTATGTVTVDIAIGAAQDALGPKGLAILAAAHSLRSAAAVSRSAARRAGRSLASAPAASSPIRPAASVAASWGAIP